MIRIVDGRFRYNYPEEIDQMHKLRKKVFHERMGWDVSVVNSWEIDGYDALSPLYLIYIDQLGLVGGSLRLLPTTGFTMINDTFSCLLPDSKRIESPLIWESSRFSVDHEADGAIGKKGISRVTAELGLAMNEIGMQVGLTHIVTVYDGLMHRILSRAGCAGEPISAPQKIGKILSYAVFFEIGMATDAALRAASELEGSVLESRAEIPTMSRAA